MADTLSRAVAPGQSVGTTFSEKLAERKQIPALPIADTTIQMLKTAVLEDATFREIILYVENGWPNKRDISLEPTQYYPLRDKISVEDGLLMFDGRVLVPRAVRNYFKQVSHASHKGRDASIQRAKQAVYWPNMSREIADLVAR